MSTFKTTMRETRPYVVVAIGIALLTVATLVYVFGPTGRLGTTRSQKIEVLLRVPLPGDADSYTALVEESAEKSEMLLISEACVVKPEILKLHKDQILNIRNIDSELHTIVFENQNAFTVSPRDSRRIAIGDLLKIDSGVLRYKCLESEEEGNSGLLYIEPY